MFHRPLNRRRFLNTSMTGLGGLALSSLLRQPSFADESEDEKSQTKPKVKSVIWLFMNGGPSQIDLFDPKPELAKWDGKMFPGKIETLFPHPGPIMKSPFTFKQHGESGAPVSNLLPRIAEHVDDLTFLNACVTDAQNHGPALYKINTGSLQLGSPHIGSWATYGLGSANEDLPAFAAMYDYRSCPETGVNLWDSGFLPSEYQGVTMRPGDRPILYVDRHAEVSADAQVAQLDLLQQLNRHHAEQRADVGELQSRIKSFETAFRMQMSVPELTDISDETAATKGLYGLNDPKCKYFGTQLLLARRMVQRGVRFIQIYHGGAVRNWDQHFSLKEDHEALSYEIDQPISALLTDLKRSGVLDSTLVIWGGEFGRTPTSQDVNGRDHNPSGFTMWMAGGGLRRGMRYGQTDEFGHKAIEDSVNVHDIHATILQQLGIDHSSLTYRFGGRDQTATNALGDVIEPILA